LRSRLEKTAAAPVYGFDSTAGDRRC
jgi:hypothetical protein